MKSHGDIVASPLPDPLTFAARVDAMQASGVNARWQAEMAPFFELADGDAPDRAMVPLPEIFHLD